MSFIKGLFFLSNRHHSYKKCNFPLPEGSQIWVTIQSYRISPQKKTLSFAVLFSGLIPISNYHLRTQVFYSCCWGFISFNIAFYNLGHPPPRTHDVSGCLAKAWCRPYWNFGRLSIPNPIAAWISRLGETNRETGHQYDMATLSDRWVN